MRKAIALTWLAMIPMFVATPLSLAATITVDFNGPAGFIDDRVPPPQNIVTFVTGHVTVNTSVPSADDGSPLDEGVALFYAGAITEFGFTSDLVSRVLPGTQRQIYNTVQVYHDYNRCLGWTSDSSGNPVPPCGKFQAELDGIHFAVAVTTEEIDEWLELIIIGSDRNLLSSGEIPRGPLDPAHLLRIDFFWHSGPISLASNSMSASYFVSSVPESSTSILVLCGFLAVGLGMARRRC